jgi:hypothetical protein
MTDLPPADLLKIVQFCWPDDGWHTVDGEDGKPSMLLFSEAGDHWGCYWPQNVSAAELALIERGLAEEYGRALAIEMRWCGRDGRWTGWLGSTEQIAEAATAPLDARCRAMLAVVEKHTSPTPGEANEGKARE